jgi:putative DNA primase/helicase
MVGQNHVSNLLEHLRAQCLLGATTVLPSWLRNCEWKIRDIIVTRNKIVHIPSFVAGNKDYSIPATPALFSVAALDYDFETTAPKCENWMRFLDALWPNEPESISLLQEWFGYMLTPDTSQQKALLVIGPKRSGKGTIARTLRSLVGENNTCGPTLSSLQTNFGLWPLIGKTAAIISDARLSGRSDQAVITERLLAISGEDAMTIDRKNMEPITTKLLTRFTIISNELPRLQDASGALASRLVILRLTRSFYGREDRALTEKIHKERAGIIHWAIEGWRRLNERGYFVQPEASEQLAEQMQELSSPIDAFVRERCEVGPECSIEIKELYKAWSDWCEDVGRDATGLQVFCKDLVALLPSLNRKHRRFGAHRSRWYDGIGLSTEGVDDGN